MADDGNPRSEDAPEGQGLPAATVPAAAAPRAASSTRTAASHRQSAEELLDALPSAAIVLRSDAQVLFRNAVAVALDSIWLDAAGQRLQRLGQYAYAALVKLIDLPAGSPPRSAAVAQRVDAALHRSTLQIVPIDQRPALAQVWPSAHVLLLLEAPREGTLPGWLEQFGKHHRLTKAEMNVLSMLVDGDDLPRIAVRAGIAYSTVRTHMRMLLEKTGTSRQGELLAAVLRL